MNQIIPDESAFPPIFCPTCGTRVETELVNDLAQGITIFCASCGHKFDYEAHKHRLNSKVKSPVKTPTKSRTSPSKYNQPHPLDYSFSSQPVSSAQSPSSENNFKSMEDQQAKSKEYHRFRQIQKKNRRAFRQVKKTNRNRFKTPQQQNRHDYRLLQHNYQRNYVKTRNENFRVYQISLLSDVVANPAEISKLKRNLNRIKRNNQRDFRRTKRTYANSYKRIRKSNLSTFRKAKRANRQTFYNNNEANQQLWQKYSLTMNDQYLNFASFEPIYIPVEDFRAFDPSIFTSMDPEMIRQSELTKTPIYSSDTISNSHLYGQSTSNVPKKVAKFDPMTGKPLSSSPIPAIRFDTITGKPIQNPETPEAPEAPEAPLQKGLDKTILSPISEKMPRSHLSQEILNTPIKEDQEEETFGNLKEIYTVLDEDVREGLLNLPISEEDRDMIAKSFIYLNYSQQIKYLEELSSVNIADLETRKELIHVIQNLPIPRPQKEFLIEQLQYLNETEQTDFVFTLERAQSEGITEKLSLPIKSPGKEAPPTDGQHLQKEDSETSSQQNEIEISAEANSETIQEDLSPEFLVLQKERDKLLQLKQEKLSEEILHQQALEKQKLEEERLERVKNLKEKIKLAQESEENIKKSSQKKKQKTEE